MTIRRMNLALVILLCACAATTAQAQLSLQSSLTPLNYTPTRSMPDPDGVPKYPNGVNLPAFGSVGVGTQMGVAYFLTGLDRSGYDMRQNRDKLVDDLAVYEETVNEDGGALIKKAKTVTLKQLDDFNLAVGGGLVYERLKKYRLVHIHEQQSLAAVAAAWQDVNAAIAEIDQVNSKAYVRDLKREQASLSKQKADILEKAKKAAWVKDALGTVKSAISTASSIVEDPSKLNGLLIDGAAGIIDDILVQRVLDENWEVLNRIDQRLAAIETAIPNEEDKQLKSQLTEAQSHLTRSRLKLFSAQLDEKLTSVEAWDLLDLLASSERGYKKINLFQNLHLYNADMRHMATLIQLHGSNYLNMLDSGAPGFGPRLLADINRDMDNVFQANNKSATGEYGAWLKRAGATQAYVKQHVSWYTQERDDVVRQLGAIQLGANLALVDGIVQHVLGVLQSTTDF